MRKAITADAFRQAIAPEELLALAGAKCGAMTLRRKLAAFEGFARPYKPAAIREPAGRSIGRERNLEPFQHPPSGELVTARHLNLLLYEQERRSFGAFIVEHARALGAYMQSQLLTEHEREMAELYRSTDAIMRETAIAPKGYHASQA